MEKYFLDKIIDEGTTYRAESDKALIIEAVGTDSTSKAVLKVAGSPVLEIIDNAAPLHRINTNLNGPLKLGPQYIVVPPDKPFSFSGATDSLMRLIGNILVFEPDEVLPTEDRTRYGEQPRIYLSYIADSETRAAGTTITAGTEDTIGTPFTCPAGEKWTFAHLTMLNARYDTTVIAAKQFGFRIYVDDKPFDIVETAMGRLGIANRSAPYPPSEAINFVPFSLEAKPIVLTEGRTLKTTFINTDVDWTVPTGTTATFEWLYIGVKEILI